MKSKIFKIIVWSVTLLWLCMIFYFSSKPSTESLQESGDILVHLNQLEESEIYNTTDSRVFDLHYYVRKSAHFILYSGLGFLTALSIVLIRYKSYTSYIIAWLAAALYGVSDEAHQYFIPGRGPTFADIKLDTISALAGVVTAAVIVELYRRYGSKSGG